MTNTQTKDRTCTERVKDAKDSRLADLRTLWELDQTDPEAYHEELGNFSEYGLSFDYVTADTFEDLESGYFRYQISYGGPSEEIRFYCDPEFNVYKIEFWYLDWFDGAPLTLHGEDSALMREIFEFFTECGSTRAVFDEACE